jgi:hypothetical protein
MLTSDRLLIKLYTLLSQDRKIGISVYTNSEILKKTVEEIGLPCTLIKPNPSGVNKIKLIIFDDVEQYFVREYIPQKRRIR